MSATPIFYNFSRQMVLRQDLEPFLGLYDMHKLPIGRELKARMGRMIFGLEDYDSDRREPYAVPEVRRFYSAFHYRWPHWQFFCDLAQDDLRVMTFSCLASVMAIHVEGQTNGAIAYDRRELDQFLDADRKPFLVLCFGGAATKGDQPALGRGARLFPMSFPSSSEELKEGAINHAQPDEN